MTRFVIQVIKIKSRSKISYLYSVWWEYAWRKW